MKAKNSMLYYIFNMKSTMYFMNNVVVISIFFANNILLLFARWQRLFTVAKPWPIAHDWHELIRYIMAVGSSPAGPVLAGPIIFIVSTDGRINIFTSTVKVFCY